MNKEVCLLKKILLLILCLTFVSFAAYAEAPEQTLNVIENGTVSDFDGDGVEEPVAFVTERDEYGDGSFTLTVGDTTYTQDNCMMLNEELRAVSIYTKRFAYELDGTLFIASEEGPSDDPVSYCYFYTGGHLYDVGTIESSPEDMVFSCDEIETVVRTDVLGTWRRDAKFMIAHGYANTDSEETFTEVYHLTEVAQDLYSMGLIYETKIDLPLQASRTDDTIVATVPAASSVILSTTDNLHWIYAESLDGQYRGWFYFDASDYPTLININGNMTDEGSVFRNMLYAD